MYAHSVIEDLKWQSQRYSSRATLHRALISSIEKSQKFHFGSIEGLDGITNQKEGDAMFMNDPSSIKLPYDLCWFDWCVELPCEQEVRGELKGLRKTIVTGEAVLVARVTDTVFQVVAFSRYAEWQNKWGMNPVSGVVFIGGSHYKDNAQIQKRLNLGKCDRAINLLPIPVYDIDDYVAKVGTVELTCNLQYMETSIKILNCKNISTEIIKPSDALNKKRRKNGKQELFDYYVLNVSVPSRRDQSYRNKSEPSSHNRIHLCRGHFKEYTEEHPLFGKLTGLYWWQPHVRGQNKEGIVMKDYKVVPKF